MGPELRRFYIEGAVKESEHLVRKQAHEEMRLKKRMLNEGYVPVLDITPLVGETRDPDKGTTRYVITMYGTKVEGDAWQYEGWLNGELIKASTGTKFERLLSRSGLSL